MFGLAVIDYGSWMTDKWLYTFGLPRRIVIENVYIIIVVMPEKREVKSRSEWKVDDSKHNKQEWQVLLHYKKQCSNILPHEPANQSIFH